MKHLGRSLLVMVIILVSTVVCLAQDNQSACDNIESAILSKAPIWKIVRKSRFPCQKLSYFKLQFGKDLVYVFIYPHPSREDATSTFRYLASDEEFYGRKVDILGSGWRNSKEQNRVWKAWNGETGVDVQKGQIVVRVSASTLPLSRKFAEWIGDALPDA